LLSSCAFIAACSSDDAKTTPGTDAGSSSGGATGTGGKGSSGATGTGGKASGGATGTGGTASGGVTGAGGKASGGATGTGGSTVVTDGGDTDGGIPAPPALGKQIDRMGRPAINTALNNTFETNATTKGAAKDAYNDALPPAWPTFKAEFQKNLAILDSLDGSCGNQLLAGATATADRYATLAGVLTDDQLYVNSAVGACGVYLGVEAEAVSAVGAGAGKCGGRTPKDDVIERSYSVLAAGILSGVDDTITADDGSQTTTFPFLGAPDLADGG
jgi:hypothetical protein